VIAYVGASRHCEDPRMVRHAQVSDAAEAGRLLDAFNREFGEPTPGAEAVARRVAALLEADEAVVLLAGDGPDAVLVLRLRPALWAEGLDAYVEELYVVPEARRRGHGRALMQAAIAVARTRGAVRIELFTGDDDLPARALYESLGLVHDGELYYGGDV
jgi:ribosomal protein S18 acetylase RimI-like enzyme